MEEKGAVLFVNDDLDDQYIFEPILNELLEGHPILFVEGGQATLNYLRNTAEKPFLIISEMRMSGMDGLELRRQIDADPVLRKRAIPFVFFTNSVFDHLVDEAYEMLIQGIFRKGGRLEESRKQLKIITTYWKNCVHPAQSTPS